MACCMPEDLHCDFVFQYPIEIFLSIKSVANILRSSKKSFSFLTALLHSSTINFIYETVRQCV